MRNEWMSNNVVDFYFWGCFNIDTAILFCVGIGKPNTPTIKTKGSWSISISITAPPGADTSRRIIYLIRYRNVRENKRYEYPETENTTVTITKLLSFTHYALTVKAKYQGGEYGPASDPLRFQTKCGKC